MYHYADAVEALADMLGDDPVLTHAGQHRSWRDFENRAARLGQAFADAGLKPGSKVGLLLYNCSEYYEAFLAALKMRMVPFNINYRYVGTELAYLLENSDCEALVYHRSLAGVVEEVLPGAKLVKLALEVDDGEGPTNAARGYEAAIAAAAPAPRIARQPDDYHLMYTGGTTGMPKGVICEVAPWTTGLVAMFAKNVLGLDPPPADLPQLLGTVKVLRSRGVVPVIMPSSPLMHTAGLANSLPFQLLGGRCVTLPNKTFDPIEIWRTIASERVMATVIVGDAFARPMLDALDDAKARGETLDLSSLKIVISSGVIWSQGVKEKMLEWLDATLIDGVGATEGPMALQISRRGQAGASARFVPLAETRLFAEDGREIPRSSDEPGLIAAGGPAIPAGYYKDPEKTAKTFRIVDGQRFAFIGDWGRWNADGTMQLLGRGSACINTGGEKVYPEEVEHVLASHPDVADCLVIGLPDERFGQRVVALVAARRTDASLAAALPEFVQGKMAGYKRPRAFFEVEAVPRMPNGKADYKAARAIAERLAQQ
ncbi:MAG: AMP-binding protein [Steroidobacteraceae bacterium]|nr:AMP-binding protein [Steroidobacteraceae bacterium]